MGTPPNDSQNLKDTNQIWSAPAAALGNRRSLIAENDNKAFYEDLACCRIRALSCEARCYEELQRLADALGIALILSKYPAIYFLFQRSLRLGTSVKILTLMLETSYRVQSSPHSFESLIVRGIS